jgi:ATP-dependent Clp protease adapter protein ClpS
VNAYAIGLAGAMLVLCGQVAGCASVRDDAVRALNVSGDFGAAAEVSLEALDKHEQEDAVAHAWSQDQAEAAVAQVRSKYAGAWRAYRDYRVAMLAAQAAVQLYDSGVARGAPVDVSALQRAVDSMESAETAFVQAMQAARESGSAPPAQKDGGA